MTATQGVEHAQLHHDAYAAFDSGRLADASRLFARLLEGEPDSRRYHYMRGLAHKYLRDWPASLHHNLQAIGRLEDGERGEAERWNAAIAATALGDWSQARMQWAACGIDLPAGTGPVEGDFGVAVVRLNAWDDGETVWMRRIDPVRARLLNVPFPESGYCFADIVLHDGASTGKRFDGQRHVPVFNAMARLQPSPFRTFTAFVGCAAEADVRPLIEATAPGLGHIEDWTGNTRVLCLRCSYGTPHEHVASAPGAWTPDRSLGISAQSRSTVDALLQRWVSGGPGRRIDGVETRDHPVPAIPDGRVWWLDPDEVEPD